MASEADPSSAENPWMGSVPRHVRGLVNGVSGRNAAHLFELIGSAGRITVSDERPPRMERPPAQ